MKPGKPAPDQDDLLRARLVEMIDMRHELVKLEALIDWDILSVNGSGCFRPIPVALRHHHVWSLVCATFSMPLRLYARPS